MSARSFDINKLYKKQSMITVSIQGDSKCIMMYRTCIVAVNNSGITLNSGGWRTPTTKVAINRALDQIPQTKGCQVFQKYGVWYLSKADGTKIEFKDGMTINF